MAKSRDSGESLVCEQCGTVVKVPMAREGELFTCPKCQSVLVAPRDTGRPKPRRREARQGLLEDMPEHRVELPDVPPSRPQGQDGIVSDPGSDDFGSFLDSPAESVTIETPAAPPSKHEDEDAPLDWDEADDEADRKAEHVSATLPGDAAEKSARPPVESDDDDQPLDWEDADDDDPLAAVVPPAIAAQATAGDDRETTRDSGDLLWDDAASDPERRSPIDAAPARPAKSTLPAIDEDAEFGVTCPLCGTRSYATLRQVGKSIQCPDCHSKFPVRQPKNPPRQKASAPVGGGAEFKLAETFERPVYQPLVKPLPPPDELEDDDDWWPRRKKRDADKGDGPSDDADPLGTAGAFFAFLPQPDAIMIGVCIFVGLLACTSFLTFATHPGDLGLIAILPGMTLFGVCACFLLVLVAKTAIGIVKETANGAREVDDWPNWNVVDWIGQAGAGIVSLMISTGPAALLTQLVCFLFMPWHVSVALALFVTAMTHPFILLSILETGSIFSPISTNVARGLTKLPGFFLMAYVGSVGLGFLCGVELLLLAWAGYWGMIPLSALWVFTFYMYCRLVGLVGHHLRIGSEEEVFE
jgi:predicted RNA-binding Zn-ribbon protein involved in translation (DUF1610 family)